MTKQTLLHTVSKIILVSGQIQRSKFQTSKFQKLKIQKLKIQKSKNLSEITWDFGLAS